MKERIEKIGDTFNFRVYKNINVSFNNKSEKEKV